MFDIGWSEMLVIAVVLIVVVGPSDLPKVLRSFGKYAGQLRRMAGDFQRQVNDAMREAELDDVRRDIESVRRINPASQVRSMLTGDGKGEPVMEPLPAPAEQGDSPAGTPAVKPERKTRKPAATKKPAAKASAKAKPASGQARTAKPAASKPAATKPVKTASAKKPPAKPARKGSGDA